VVDIQPHPYPDAAHMDDTACFPESAAPSKVYVSITATSVRVLTLDEVLAPLLAQEGLPEGTTHEVPAPPSCSSCSSCSSLLLILLFCFCFCCSRCTPG
jgi:hypothetical protein